MVRRRGADGGGTAASGAAGRAGHAASPSRLYVVVTWVPRRTTIAVGSLGPVTFARGWYAYVGSARRARGARVARHLRAEKPLRWHADHLFARYPGRRAWLVDGGLTECELAAALAGLPGAERRPPRFGAGDCRCAGHLVELPERLTRRALAALLASPARVRSHRWPRRAPGSRRSFASRTR
jgi:Uri superfamily endonuclease